MGLKTFLLLSPSIYDFYIATIILWPLPLFSLLLLSPNHFFLYRSTPFFKSHQIILFKLDHFKIGHRGLFLCAMLSAWKFTSFSYFLYPSISPPICDPLANLISLWLDFAFSILNFLHFHHTFLNVSPAGTNYHFHCDFHHTFTSGESKWKYGFLSGIFSMKWVMIMMRKNLVVQDWSLGFDQPVFFLSMTE